ncbi:hypothetical protein WA538_005220 [Blastocystis sp. DL]
MLLSELEQIHGSISNIDVWYGDYPLVCIVCENGLCFSVPIISYTQKRSVDSVVADLKHLETRYPILSSDPFDLTQTQFYMKDAMTIVLRLDGSSSDSAIVAPCEGGSVSSNASKNASYNASSNTSPNPPINASNTTPINPPALSVATADRIAVLWEPSPTLTHRLTALHAPSLATDLLCSLDFRMPGAETPLLRTLRECDRTLREASAPLPSRLLWVTVASLLALAHTTPLPPSPALALPTALLSLLHTLLLRYAAHRLLLPPALQTRLAALLHPLGTPLTHPLGVLATQPPLALPLALLLRDLACLPLGVLPPLGRTLGVVLLRLLPRLPLTPLLQGLCGCARDPRCRQSLRTHLLPREFAAALPALDSRGITLALSFATLLHEPSLSPAVFLPYLRHFPSPPAELVEAWAQLLLAGNGTSVAETMELPRNCLLRGTLSCAMPFTRELLAADLAALPRGTLPAPLVAQFFSSVGALFEDDAAALSRAVAALSVFAGNDRFRRELCDETLVCRLATLIGRIPAGDGVLVALLELLGHLLASDPLGGACLPLPALWDRLSVLARTCLGAKRPETAGMLRLAGTLVTTTICCAPPRRFLFASRALLATLLVSPRESELLAYVEMFRGFDRVEVREKRLLRDWRRLLLLALRNDMHVLALATLELFACVAGEGGCVVEGEERE